MPHNARDGLTAMRLSIAHRSASVGAVALSLALTCLVGRSAGQGTAPPEMHASLAGQLRMFQLRMVSGRISATGPVSSQNLTSNYMGSQRRERLSIDLAGGLPNVIYECASSDQRISYEIERGSEVTVRLLPRSPSDRETVVFKQPAQGDLTLAVGSDRATVTYHAPTLWHLLVIEPAVCREHLIPMLEIMRPNWQLDQQEKAIELSLCRATSGRDLADPSSWRESLAALASPRFVERERAEGHLRSAGPVVLQFLRDQDRAGLDAEQSFRIRRIIRSLADSGGEDSPDRVAPWLRGDPRVWYALLDRDSPAVRRLAADKLARLLRAAVEFDADATAPTRAEQIARLRDRFGDVLTPPEKQSIP